MLTRSAERRALGGSRSRIRSHPPQARTALVELWVGQRMYRRLLLVNDGTLDAGGALEPSLILARRLDAELHMILVEELPRFPATITEVVGEKLVADQRLAYVAASAQRRAEEAQIRFLSHVVVGRLIDRVIEFIEKNQVDLVIVSAKGARASGFFFSRTTERLVRLAPCAVHVVK